MRKLSHRMPIIPHSTTKWLVTKGKRLGHGKILPKVKQRAIASRLVRGAGSQT